MSPPQVSVVIAAWNAAEYLPQTLASALAQTWPALEVIVVDDGSTDSTADAVAPFLPRIRFERRPHRGLAAARNEGIRLARGRFIAPLDADDLWDREKIALQVALAERQPSSGLIVCDAAEFDDGGIIQARLLPDDLFAGPAGAAAGSEPADVVTGDFQRLLIGRCLINCPAQVLLPRHVVDRIGPFIDSGAQDYDYYLRVSRQYPVTFQRQVLARWRFRADSMSGPRAERPIRWGLDTLPVLTAHLARCRDEDRALLEQRLRTERRLLCRQLMLRGRENRQLAAGRQLLQTLRTAPWPPTALLYLLALRLPDRLYRMGRWLWQRRPATHGSAGQPLEVRRPSR